MNKTVIYLIYIIVSFGLPYVVLMQFIKADDVVQFLMGLTVVFINSLLYPALRTFLFLRVNSQLVIRSLKCQINLKNIVRYFGLYFGVVLISGLILSYGYARDFNMIIFAIGVIIFWYSSDIFDKCFNRFIDEKTYNLRVLAGQTLETLQKIRQQDQEK